MPLESTHFFIHPQGAWLPGLQSSQLSPPGPGPGWARKSISPRGGCLDHHSWKWSCPCLWTHVGYVAHSTQMAFYIYCLAYLVIFSHVYVCFQQADNRTFWEQEDHQPQFFPWAPCIHGLKGRRQRTHQQQPTCSRLPAAQGARGQGHPISLSWGVSLLSWWLSGKTHEADLHLQMSASWLTGWKSTQKESFRNSGLSLPTKSSLKK